MKIWMDVMWSRILMSSVEDAGSKEKWQQQWGGGLHPSDTEMNALSQLTEQVATEGSVNTVNMKTVFSD